MQSSFFRHCRHQPLSLHCFFPPKKSEIFVVTLFLIVHLRNNKTEQKMALTPYLAPIVRNNLTLPRPSTSREPRTVTVRATVLELQQDVLDSSTKCEHEIYKILNVTTFPKKIDRAGVITKRTTKKFPV